MMTVRKMGNSLGVVIPKDDVAKLKLHEGDKVEIEVRKAEGIEAIFGMFKGQLAPRAWSRPSLPFCQGLRVVRTHGSHVRMAHST